MKLFVDGVRIGSGTPGPAAIDYGLPSGSTQVGNYGDPASGCSGALNVIGDVDGVQVWSTALPVESIWAILRPIINLAR